MKKTHTQYQFVMNMQITHQRAQLVARGQKITAQFGHTTIYLCV